MREIIFRAKDIHTSEWMEGYFSKDYAGVAYITTLDGVSTSTVDEATLGQFTGLLDKNGNRVFEGDIIATKFFPQYVERISWKGDPDAICEVYWDFSGYGLKAKGGNDFRYPGLHEMNFKETEVVGNIWDNPELIKSIEG